MDLLDVVRMKHGVIVGGTGSGKSTFLENIIAQDVMRRFGSRKMPMIIFDGKGEREFLHRLLPHIEAAGRLQDLRVIDPTHPAESARYNPFYALDDAYQEHVNFIFRSFGLREDFFKGHQEAYLSDLVRILQYTGKLFNVYDVLVMALDEKVLEEQIGVAKARLASVPGISMQKRLTLKCRSKAAPQITCRQGAGGEDSGAFERAFEFPGGRTVDCYRLLSGSGGRPCRSIRYSGVL